MKRVRADLHIHSVLSPCADLTMSPRRIVEEARKAGLALIAITDHNAGENGRYARQLAGGAPVVLMGMEIQTQEEVEVLAYFEDEARCLELQEELYAELPDVECRPELFGDQVVVDSKDEIVRTMDKLLLSPVPWSLERLAARVDALGGWAVPAHVDRAPGGLLAMLGMLPPGDWPMAVEIAPWTSARQACSSWPELARMPLFRSSDAHFPHEIGRGWTEIVLSDLTLAELRAAVRAEGGRSVRPSRPVRTEVE